MDNVILHTIAKKMEAHDKDIGELNEQVNRQQEDQKKTDTRVNEVEEGLNKIHSALSFPVEQVERLSSLLTQVIVLLHQPRRQEVRHHHHIGRAIIVMGVLLLIVVVQAVLLTRAWNRRGEEQESAIKYRYLKLVPDSVLQKVLFRTDSLFQEQGEGFRKKVLKDEARLHEQWMLQRQIEQKENEVKHLKERARKKY